MQAGFPDMEECQRRGQDDSLGVWERMKYYLLSPIPGSALTKALPLIKGNYFITIVLFYRKCSPSRTFKKATEFHNFLNFKLKEAFCLENM